MSFIALCIGLAASAPPVRAIEIETKAVLPVFAASTTEESIGVGMALSSLALFGEGATVRAITAAAPRLMNAASDDFDARENQSASAREKRSTRNDGAVSINIGACRRSVRAPSAVDGSGLILA